MPSTPQVLTTVTVFDYLYDASGKALPNQDVEIRLNYNRAAGVAPVVWVPSSPIRVTTDSNGYWQAQLVANAALLPSNTTYTVRHGGQSYDIQIPSGAGPFQASAIVTSAPATLQPSGPWATWAPTVTPHGAMTMTPGAHASNHARWAQLGKLVFMSYSQLFTFGGVASDGADFTLPTPARDNRNTFSGLIQNIMGFAFCGDTTLFLTLLKYDGSNVGLAPFHASFNGFYEVP